MIAFCLNFVAATAFVGKSNHISLQTNQNAVAVLKEEATPRSREVVEEEIKSIQKQLILLTDFEKQFTTAYNAIQPVFSQHDLEEAQTKTEDLKNILKTLEDRVNEYFEEYLENLDKEIKQNGNAERYKTMIDSLEREMEHTVKFVEDKKDRLVLDFITQASASVAHARNELLKNPTFSDLETANTSPVVRISRGRIIYERIVVLDKATRRFIELCKKEGYGSDSRTDVPENFLQEVTSRCEGPTFNERLGEIAAMYAKVRNVIAPADDASREMNPNIM
jgi:hypothetical protein